MTSEGGKYWLRRDPFLGLQALSWNYDETTFAREDWPGKPKDFNSLPIELCAYTPMQAEPNIMNLNSAVDLTAKNAKITKTYSYAWIA